MKKLIKVLKGLFLLGGVFVVAFPFLWCVLLSFKSNGEIMTIGGNLLPEVIVLDGYRKVLQDAPFFRWLFNSAFTSLLTTGIVALTSCIGGYIFGKFEFKGKNLLFMIILATMSVPFQVTMIPLYMIINKLGMANSLTALVIPFIVSGFGIFICKQFAENIPTDMMESARIEGAGEWTIFLRIIMPMLKSGASALCIFTFMGRWNDYLWPLIVINEEKKMTLPLALDFFNSHLFTDYNASMSAAVLIMLPIMIVYMIFQRQIVESIALTGGK